MNDISVFTIKEMATLTHVRGIDILIDKENAISIKNNILEKIKLNSKDDKKIIVLDFEGIEKVSVTALRIFVFEVINEFVNNKKHINIILKNCDKILVDIQATQIYTEKLFEKNANKRIIIPFLMESNNEIHVIGRLEQSINEVYETLKSKKSISARQISNIHNITINSANNRLKKLYDLNLVNRKEIVDSHGKYFIYSLICIDNR